jgi:hypothetical protein
MLYMLGSHHIHKDKIGKIPKKVTLIKKVEFGNAFLVPLRSVLFHLYDAKSDVVIFYRF